MNGGSIGIALAFSAGLLSFLSPCVLPLVPSYLSFVTGLALEDVQRARRAAFVHTLLFVSGFTLVFLALAATATVLGSFLKSQQVWIARFGGVLLIVFGLFLLGVLNIGAFGRERRMHLSDKPLGYLGTVFVGIAFGAGWTPCIGPVLGGILTYAASEADVARGMWLLTAYSLGLAVPFLLASVALGRFFAVFEWIRRHLALMNRISGTMLIMIGVLMLTNRFALIASALARLTPKWLLDRL
ncbi:MAG TPA: cytochrome c biogenesis protein CcdA [Gemmatimonadaceae bacterium]|nr:cytochrome c biogenesis protein CcdA [Gemmatimonadaceae bacterium]